MAKFSFKSLFIKDTESEEEVEKMEEQAETSTFPEKVEVPNYENTPVIKTPPPVSQTPINPSNGTMNEEVLNQVIEMYAKGFDSLNKSGYDFFEFFKSITAVSEQTPQVYTMAFQMGKTMAPQVTKQSLLADADYYISEINGVHQKFQAQGEKKKEQIKGTVLAQKEALQKEIAQLQTQIAQLKAQISDLEVQQIEKTAALDPLESQNLPEIQNIDQKLLANDYARGVIVKQIENVKQGIQNHI